MRAPRRHARGYTFVELLMSVLIFSIGVSGVIAMQKVTVTANQHARDLGMATQIAQAWMSQLHADAIAWNQPSISSATDDLSDTKWLASVANTNKAWVLPTFEKTRNFGPAFDLRGQPIDSSQQSNAARVKFCTQLRLSWLYNPTSNTSVRGDGLIRAEVRVFWLRDGSATTGNKGLCSQGLDPSAEPNRYHFVYQVSALRENTAL
jgi:prepilin-type N-terminal cleavage/methylation domain-containing protein